ncbi:hypothetical protein FIBSPDRAFT_850200 [Athelia psychrophila]|uniref:AB hydrolase-1 domain-containing protein n=1 Tax=Athelia psychrophila TaxID=1759441 RepID=A0A166TLQ3_9AGAM|nr:hypothetical protein FIBSPDRAFT_850200 [Fibularhizoctonia sp. CBS 109695]
MSSFDPPPTQPSFRSINPRTLFPILPHPKSSLQPPALPSPPRPPTFNDQYALSTHIVPAAYPRVAPDAPLPQAIPAGLNKEERKQFLAEQTDTLVRAHERFEELGTSCGTGVLWICVNRYSLRAGHGIGRGEKRKGLTLFFAHANGFPKEIWEPSLHHLLADYSGPEISEIWTWEAVHHGDSYLLNQAQLSGRCDWMDNARDIMNFLVNYLPTAATQAVLPVHLPRVPSAEAEIRQMSGYAERTMVVVGHSYGGCSSASVAVHCPALFSSLVLVDPVIIQHVERTEKYEIMYRFVQGALGRRDGWSSKEEALRLFEANPFFAAWDPDVLRSYIEHGLTPDPAGGVKLKTPGMQEALTFASETRLSNEVWELLERIDDRVALRWMMPGDQNALSHPIGNEDETRVKVWRRPANASNVRMPAGHLIPHERPREFAMDLRGYLERTYLGDKRARL